MAHSNKAYPEWIKRLPILRQVRAVAGALRREHERDVERLSARADEAIYLHYKHLAPDQYAQAVADWYRLRTGETLDLENPRTFNEKIQWLKIFDATPLKRQLVDKLRVRDWVAAQIGEDYLIPLLGCWDRFADIDFDALPDRFALKANHGSGWNVIVKDKRTFDRAEARRRFDRWMRLDFAFCKGLELDYHGVPPKILAEAFIENAGGQLYDYKVWCFGGKPQFVMFLADRGTHLKMANFDLDWKLLPFVYGYPQYAKPVPRPPNLDELLALAEKMARGFPFARVDFYRLDDGSLKFGEMTFTPYSGVCNWDPPEWNLKLGAQIPLPIR